MNTRILGLLSIGCVIGSISLAASAETAPAKAPAAKPAAAKPAATKPAATPAPKPAEPPKPASITSDTHPGGLIYTFNNPDGPPQFMPYQPPGGVASGAQLSVQNGALVLRNAYAGSFSVDTKTPAFDAMKLGHLFFDYKLSPDVKVNVFFRSKGVYYCAVFCGPPRVRPGGVMMGAIEDVKADNKWRRAHIPLRDWLRRLNPTSDALPIEEVLIGNWDNAGYLMAGFGGNPPGATWNLDNWSLAPTGNSEAHFTVADAPQGSTWALDDDKAAPLTKKDFSVKSTDGFHILRLRDKAGKEVAARPFFTASAAPRAGEAAVAGNQLVLGLQAQGGLDLNGLSLKVGDKAYDRNSPFLEWDGTNSELRLSAARAGFAWKDGDKIDYSLTGIKDLLGRTTADKSGALSAEFSKAAAKPRAPRYRLSSSTNTLNAGDFEDGLDGWSNAETGGTIIERDNTTAFAGEHSLRLTCPGNAVPFRAWIRRDGFDAAQYPVITFAYKVPNNLRVDFLLGYDGVSYSIKFTDKDAAYKRIAEVPNVVADDQWHRATINLRDILQTIKPGQEAYKVDWLAIGDTGWLGNARNTQYWLDDFYFVPRSAAPAKLELTLEDISGIKAVAWDRNASSERVPATEPSSAGNSIEIAESGLFWLNARVQNGAGHWSEPVHLPVYVGN